MVIYKYEIVIYWSQEDNSFIAEVPELAGCMADGKTQKEALENVEIIISEWIETAMKEMTILMFYTSLRVGEALCLKWENVDFKNEFLDVKNTWDLTGFKETTPKTHASAAAVPIPKHIVEMLKQIKKESEKKIYGFNEKYYIFWRDKTLPLFTLQ